METTGNAWTLPTFDGLFVLRSARRQEACGKKHTGRLWSFKTRIELAVSGQGGSYHLESRFTVLSVWLASSQPKQRELPNPAVEASCARSWRRCGANPASWYVHPKL